MGQTGKADVCLIAGWVGQERRKTVFIQNCRNVSLVAVLCGLAMVSTSALAQGSDPLWLDELKAQIFQDETCDANYFLNVREYELGGKKVYETKVQCVDGRQFDATRTGEGERFVIKSCQPVVC